MRYRIRPRIYACFTHCGRLPIVQSSITTYVVHYTLEDGNLKRILRKKFLVYNLN